MNFLESFVLDVPKAVPLVPAVGKHVDGDLATNGKSQALNK